MVEYKRNSKPQHDLILGTETMNELGITMDFKSQDDNHWWDHLANDGINHLQGANTLRMLKLNSSLAKEPISTQDANKSAMQTLDTKYKKTDLQLIVRGNCKHLSANHHQRDLVAPYYLTWGMFHLRRFIFLLYLWSFIIWRWLSPSFMQKASLGCVSNSFVIQNFDV